MPAQISGSQSGTVGLINALTAVNSTSGTSIDFTGIPSGAKRITVMFQGVSTSGTSALIVVLGSGSFTTSGYTSSGSGVSATVGSANATNGIILENQRGSAAFSANGLFIACLVTGNTWAGMGVLGQGGEAATRLGGGVIALAGALDRVRVTTTGGTDTFDAGTINVLYE